MSNLSEEVLRFYIGVLTSLRDSPYSNLGKVGGFGEAEDQPAGKVPADEEAEVDVVLLQRVLQILPQYFEKFLPSSVMAAFKKNIEANLKVKGTTAVSLVDLDKFLDQSIILFLRFNKLHLDNLNKLYFAFTLFTVDYLDFDQVYLMLKLLAPEGKMLTFRYPHAKQVVTRSVKAVMQAIHDKFGANQ